MATALISMLQRGQRNAPAPETSSRAALAPQCEQNFDPMNIMPKQEGHAMVARRAPQCSHRLESLDAEAPHIGQFKVSACTGVISRAQPF
jgi:hypothetical protein